MTTSATATKQQRLTELLSRAEMIELTSRSDWRGAWAILSTWAIIAAAFVLVACWPNALTVILALCILAGRQLALAILQHDASHYSLFKTRWMNDVFGDWLCARPVWQHLPKYREHHRRHHAMTGTTDDPDITLHDGYPITRASMARKMLRDITGITGLKLLIGLILMDAGVLKWTVANDLNYLPQQGRHWWNYPIDFLRNAAGMLTVNLALFLLLAATGHSWLYGLWILAYITPFPLFVRIRSLAEHGMVPRVPDMFLNTRTTRAGIVARLLVAPVHVNYHVEHHAMAVVPYYRLPQFHALLREKGVVEEPMGYWGVLKLACSRQA